MTEGTRTDGHVGRHGTAVVNGPEDDDLDWLSIDWQRVEDDARRLRQRIFTGLLEPGAVKAARRVLRGSRGSNAPGLPDYCHPG
jgi:RNA-directed DNA polymerase